MAELILRAAVLYGRKPDATACQIVSNRWIVSKGATGLMLLEKKVIKKEGEGLLLW